MVKKAAANHEEFSIAKPNSAGERFHSIREERKVPSSNSYASIANISYPTIDYSSFGFAIKSATDLDLVGNVECDFVYGEILLKNLICRKTYAHILDDNTFKIGFEVIADLIDVDVINAYQLSVDIVPEIREIIKGNESIPPMFRFMTLEFKDKVRLVRERVNNCSEQLYKRDAREFSTKVEASFSRFFAVFLKDVFESSIMELEKTLQGQSKEIVDASMAYFREEMAEYIFSAPFVSRAFRKPYGYAGDFELMNHIYNNEAIGEDLFGKCLHKAMLEAPASVAVRNRAHFLHNWLVKFIEESKGRPLRILSVASGPAREMQFLIEQNAPLLKNVEFYLLDQDLHALRQARNDLQKLARGKGLKDSVKFINKAIRNIIEEGLGDEKFDLIYSAGLFDYFGDGVAFMAGKALFENINAGGALIIGNFSSYNPTRFMMEILGDWHLVHRSEERLTKIFSPLSPKLRVESEPEGINLFTVIFK